MVGVPEAKARLEASGVDVIDLGAGDADLDPPPEAVRRLAEAASQRSMSRYPFQAGLPELRQAIATWMGHRFGVSLDPYTEILPLLGSKEGIAKLPLAFLDPGDAAVIPDPGYPAYQGGVILAGGEPYLVPLRSENDYLMPLDGIPDDVRSRLGLLYLNYPNNPTAATAPLEYLEQAVKFCREHDAVLVYDHAYSEIAFDGYRPPSILEVEGADGIALEFHSFSKTYNMTGWRLGWVAGNAALIESLVTVKTVMDIGVFKAVQAAGAAALAAYEHWVPENVARFQVRRDVAVEGLRKAGFTVTAPKATMYLWVGAGWRVLAGFRRAGPGGTGGRCASRGRIGRRRRGLLQDRPHRGGGADEGGCCTFGEVGGGVGMSRVTSGSCWRNRPVRGG